MTALSKRQRELIVLLALNPDGLERGRLAETLWPNSPPDRPFNSLHTTLSRLRHSLASTTADGVTDLIATSGDRYLLTPDAIEVDYWDFDRALAMRRTAAGAEDRSNACREIVATYTGELASGMDAEWLETPREAARRDALDAATELARSVVETDPQQALSLLEMACEFDPLNEQVYCSIIRVQGRLGRRDSIARTVTLLRTRLAEIGETPEHETLALAEKLRSRQPAQTASPVSAR
jgi:DNA-binding SARP family transcriptional activator